jgi:hypothetical protein
MKPQERNERVCGEIPTPAHPKMILFRFGSGGINQLGNGFKMQYLCGKPSFTRV